MSEIHPASAVRERDHAFLQRGGLDRGGSRHAGRVWRGFPTPNCSSWTAAGIARHSRLAGRRRAALPGDRAATARARRGMRTGMDQRRAGLSC